MSQKAAADFLGRLEQDPVLQRELGVAVAGAKDASEVVSRTVAFAAARGFEVTSEDLADAGALPLSDEDLAQVAGGAETVHLYLGRRRMA